MPTLVDIVVIRYLPSSSVFHSPKPHGMKIKVSPFLILLGALVWQDIHVFQGPKIPIILGGSILTSFLFSQFL